MFINHKLNRTLLLMFAVLFTPDRPLKAESTEELTPREIALITAFGPWPIPVPADAGNEFSGLAWAEDLGEQLFHDKSLSGDSTLSCASCHNPGLGFSDGRTVAIGKRAHVRNTQSIINVGYNRWFGWDGGADSLWAASLRPILSEVEMQGSIPVIAARFRHSELIEVILRNTGAAEVGTDEQLLVTIGKLLGAYQRTLVSPQTDFDRFRDAVLSNNSIEQQRYPVAARRGLKLFFSNANCHVCHFGPGFTNGEFHDIGRPFFTTIGQVDSGRFDGIKRVISDPYNLTSDFNGTKRPADIRKTTTVKITQSNFGQWKTPTLRNLTKTAPYMHDGSLSTLREVVDSYAEIDPTRLHSQGESILKPQNWSDQDRLDLVRFLETLSH